MVTIIQRMTTKQRWCHTHRLIRPISRFWSLLQFGNSSSRRFHLGKISVKWIRLEKRFNDFWIKEFFFNEKKGINFQCFHSKIFFKAKLIILIEFLTWIHTSFGFSSFMSVSKSSKLLLWSFAAAFKLSKDFLKFSKSDCIVSYRFNSLSTTSMHSEPIWKWMSISHLWS